MSVKGIRSSLFEANGSKADSLLTFSTRLSALDKMLFNSPSIVAENKVHFIVFY